MMKNVMKMNENGLEMTMEIAGNRSAIAVLKIESKLPFYELELMKMAVLVWHYRFKILKNP